MSSMRRLIPGFEKALLRRWFPSVGLCAGIFAAALSLGGCGRSPEGGAVIDQKSSGEIDGGALYAKNCEVCHRPGGEGISGTYPPLARSEWVNGPPRRLTALVLDGILDTETIEGHTYHAPMPAWNAALNDAQIAAVLTYIRQSWGNNAPAINSLDVFAERKETSTRKAFWTTKELMEIK